MQMYATIASAAASATPLTIEGGLLIVADVAAVMMNRWG
jgi:metal-dependent HD superfamily phosphatase/phosphodiesterase